MQAEEDASGLPRQIEHIHEVALKSGLRINWDNLYLDDSSGFQFKDRPALTELRKQYKNLSGYSIVMEQIDRLSRDSVYHPGLLLEEMRESNITPVFWKSFSSQIEQVIMSTIADIGMKDSIQRMRLGKINKAKSGRVTTRVPSYGYHFVDSDGNTVRTPGKKAIYTIDESRAFIVRLMFEMISTGRMNASGLTAELNTRWSVDSRYQPPHGDVWHRTTVSGIIKNPVYKGEFMAQRFTRVKQNKVDKYGNSVTVEVRTIKPISEWISVPVPPTVTAESWELANKTLTRNKTLSSRNAKRDYLLSGLMRCTCGEKWSGKVAKNRTVYQCIKQRRPAVLRNRGTHCDQSAISCYKIDGIVWEIVTKFLLSPDSITKAIDAKYSDENVEQSELQIRFLEESLKKLTGDDTRLYSAYMANILSMEEYGEKRQGIAAIKSRLTAELDAMKSSTLSSEQIELEKAMVESSIENVRNFFDTGGNIPFHIKRKIVTLLIDEILLDVRGGVLEIAGSIPTTKVSIDEYTRPFGSAAAATKA